MRKVTLDLEALRSFVMGIELGSFAQASERLCRSTSAVSAHLKKLESQIEQPIVQRSGRGLQLTPAGEELLSYGRRMLAVNDEAVLALCRPKISGVVRVGLQEDFGESFLTSMLSEFKRNNPNVTLDIKVSRNRDLVKTFLRRELDIVLLWSSESLVDEAQNIGRFPMQWIGCSREVSDAVTGPLPLVLFESPCRLRDAATESLDLLQRPWRIAMSSHSLSGIWAAVEAGLGITVRTPAGRPENLQVIEDQTLPALPDLELCYMVHDQSSPAVASFKETLLEELKHAFPKYMY